MKKRMLILGVAIAVVSLLSTVAFATYTYDTTDTVQITINIPVILTLDMEGSTNDITWVTVTAADLDNGYVVRRAATSMVIASNDPDGWELTVAATQTSSFLGMTNLQYKSFVVDQGSFTTTPTVQETNWVAFNADGSCATKVAEVANDQGDDCVIMLDYKILVDWDTVAADNYTCTLTFTLAGKTS